MEVEDWANMTVPSSLYRSWGNGVGAAGEAVAAASVVATTSTGAKTAEAFVTEPRRLPLSVCVIVRSNTHVPCRKSRREVDPPIILFVVAAAAATVPFIHCGVGTQPCCAVLSVFILCALVEAQEQNGVVLCWVQFQKKSTQNVYDRFM